MKSQILLPQVAGGPSPKMVGMSHPAEHDEGLGVGGLLLWTSPKAREGKTEGCGGCGGSASLVSGTRPVPQRERYHRRTQNGQLAMRFAMLRAVLLQGQVTGR